jgi:hypothetical protein
MQVKHTHKIKVKSLKKKKKRAERATKTAWQLKALGSVLGTWVPSSRVSVTPIP